MSGTPVNQSEPSLRSAWLDWTALGWGVVEGVAEGGREVRSWWWAGPGEGSESVGVVWVQWEGRGSGVSSQWRRYGRDEGGLP